MFDMFMQACLLTSRYILNLAAAGNLDAQDRRKRNFLTRQHDDALAPALRLRMLPF